jgi:DNA-binding response OmpR family regulator
VHFLGRGDPAWLSAERVGLRQEAVEVAADRAVALASRLFESGAVSDRDNMLKEGASIEEALSLARDAELHAAILDIDVGGAVFFPVADVLRERGIPVIFATGYDARGLPACFRDCSVLREPFGYDSLAGTLRTVLADQSCRPEAA